MGDKFERNIIFVFIRNLYKSYLLTHPLKKLKKLINIFILEF